MIIIKWNEELFEYPYAIRDSSSINFYDDNFQLVNQIIHISPYEWSHISVQNGDWSSNESIPTEYDHLQADIDFLQMENDALTIDSEQMHADIDFLQMLNDGLTMDNEQLRADMDYCLMLLDEPELEENNGSE